MTMRIAAHCVIAPGVELDGSIATVLSYDSTKAWFAASSMLPGIRHRYFNDITRYCLAGALRCQAEPEFRSRPERSAVLLGTSGADFAVRDQFDRPVLDSGQSVTLNAVNAPNVSANIAASHVAITCDARAFSTTLTTPFLAGFEALFLGLQALQQDRCDEALVLASEQCLPDGSVMPGALVMRLTRDPAIHGHVIHPLCWGRINDTQQVERRLVESLRTKRDACAGNLQLFVIRNDDDTSRLSALRCVNALTDMAMTGISETIHNGSGAFAPLLDAIRNRTADKGCVIVAIHQCSLLAFLFYPSTLIN